MSMGFAPDKILLIGGVPHPDKFLDSRPGGYEICRCDPSIAAPQREFASPLFRAPCRDGQMTSAGMPSGFEVKVAMLPRSGSRRPDERCNLLPFQRGRPRFFLQHRFKPRN